MYRLLFIVVLLLAPMAAAQDGTLNGTGWTPYPWTAGETVTHETMNEIKTEGDACFSTADGGTFVGGVITLNASATPALSFDDTVATDTGAESRALSDAIADDNGRIQLQVENGTDNTYVTGLSVESTAGVISGVQSGKVDRDNEVVDDDDCTGDQGKWWFDTTDGRFEFCHANSGTPEHISPEIRTEFWHGVELSTDATQCTDPARVTINSGPREWVVACPMGTAETDGFIYGSTPLEDSIDISADVIFVMYSYIVTDSGAGTLHGVIQAQCQGVNSLIENLWSTEAQLDIAIAAGDVANQIKFGSSGTVDLGFGGGAECAAGDQLFWRYKLCDSDATPSTGCTSNAGFENDLNFFGIKMEYTSLVGN